MKSIIELEVTFQNNSDVEVKVTQTNSSRAFVKDIKDILLLSSIFFKISVVIHGSFALKQEALVISGTLIIHLF